MAPPTSTFTYKCLAILLALAVTAVATTPNEPTEPTATDRHRYKHHGHHGQHGYDRGYEGHHGDGYDRGYEDHKAPYAHPPESYYPECPTCPTCPTCPVNTTACRDECVNTNNNTLNCGACGNVCAADKTCILGECGVPCDQGVTIYGGQGNHTYSVAIGTGGPTFDFLYDGSTIPDRFTVSLPNGTVIFSVLAGNSSSCDCTGCVGEEVFPNGNVTLARPPGVSIVEVLVNGYCDSTSWQFSTSCAGARLQNPPARLKLEAEKPTNKLVKGKKIQ